MATFRVLEKDEVDGEGFEIRKYTPHKRTINVCDRDYFVALPYVVFGYTKSKKCTTLSVAFAKEDDAYIYWPCVPNVNEHYTVCLGYGGQGDITTHYGHPPDKTFEQLMERFWTSGFAEFNGWTESAAALQHNYGRLHQWAKLRPQEVLDKLQYDRQPFIRFFEYIVNGMGYAASYDGYWEGGWRDNPF